MGNAMSEQKLQSANHCNNNKNKKQTQLKHQTHTTQTKNKQQQQQTTAKHNYNTTHTNTKQKQQHIMACSARPHTTDISWQSRCKFTKHTSCNQNAKQVIKHLVKYIARSVPYAQHLRNLLMACSARPHTTDMNMYACSARPHT